jgi:hypothetical protein
MVAILFVLICLTSQLYSPAHLTWKNPLPTYAETEARLQGTGSEVCSYIITNKITRIDLPLKARLLRESSLAEELSAPLTDGATLSLQIINPLQIAVVASNGRRILITINTSGVPTMSNSSSDGSSPK